MSAKVSTGCRVSTWVFLDIQSQIYFASDPKMLSTMYFCQNKTNTITQNKCQQSKFNKIKRNRAAPLEQVYLQQKSYIVLAKKNIDSICQTQNKECGNLRCVSNDTQNRGGIECRLRKRSVSPREAENKLIIPVTAVLCL